MQYLLDLFFPLNNVAIGVNTLIAVITTVMILLLYTRGFRHVRKERRYLRSLDEALEEDQERDLNEIVESLDSKSIVRQRVEDLHSLKQAGDDLDHEALAAVSTSRLEDSVRPVTWASYAVILLGFAGTLFGLTGAVEGAGQAMREFGSADTVEQALNPLTKTLEGIHVAFSTTLAGVLAALVLGAGLAAVRRDQSRFLTDLERFTQVKLLWRYRTSTGLALARTAQKLTELEQHLNKSLRAIIKELEVQGGQLVDTIEVRFESLVDTVQENASKHYDEIHSVLAKMHRYLGETDEEEVSLAESVATLSEASQVIRDDINQYRDGLADFRRSTQESYERYSELLNDSIKEHSKELDERLGQLSKTIAKGNEATEGSLTRLERVVDRIETQESTSTDVVEGLGGVAQDLRTAVDRMKQAVLIHKGVASELSTVLRRMNLRELGHDRLDDINVSTKAALDRDDDSDGPHEEGSVEGPREAIGSGVSSDSSTDGREMVSRSDEKRNATPRSLFERLFKRSDQ